MCEGGQEQWGIRGEGGQPQRVKQKKHSTCINVVHVALQLPLPCWGREGEGRGGEGSRYPRPPPNLPRLLRRTHTHTVASVAAANLSDVTTAIL